MAGSDRHGGLTGQTQFRGIYTGAARWDADAYLKGWPAQTGATPRGHVYEREASDAAVPDGPVFVTAANEY